MINWKSSSSQEESLATRTVEMEILRQPAACLFNICTSLIKGKRQSIQHSSDFSCQCLGLFRCLIKRCVQGQYSDTTQEKHHTFIQPHFFNFHTVSDRP